MMVGLSACEDGSQLKLFQKKDSGDTATASLARPAATTLIEQDVEAPEVFDASDAGLWDGRPSLGGVWVAHPDVTDPERVIIRNKTNGKFVIGALFKRERDNPGPKFQVSSDAATALGLLAGAPQTLNVTALRRKEVEGQPEAEATPAVAQATEAETIAKPEAIETTSLEPLAAAEAAIAKAEDKTKAARRQAASQVITPAAQVTPTLARAEAPKPAKLAKPFVQIGIFSIEANASRTAENLRKEGVIPTVLAQESQGKKFWRVIAGPATSTSDKNALLKKVKAMGFSDAYFVTN